MINIRPKIKGVIKEKIELNLYIEKECNLKEKESISLECIIEGEVLGRSSIITRDLINEPANIIYPETLALEAVKLGKEYGIEVEIFEENKIEEFGMKSYLEVSRAAEKRPRLIVMRYRGEFR